jgi:DNA-binding MarR family transcriptional regulator
MTAPRMRKVPDRLLASEKRSPSEVKILECLQSGEKSLNELFKVSQVRYETLRSHVLRLVRAGVMERRIVQLGRNRKYLYRLKAVP